MTTAAAGRRATTLTTTRRTRTRCRGRRLVEEEGLACEEQA
jgi:hypothetical protein